MKKKAKEEKKKQDSFSTGSGNKPILCVPLCFSEETTLTGEADCGGEWKSQIYKYLPTPMEIETSKQQSCCGVFLLQPLTFLPIENKHLSRWVGSRNRVRQVCELACQEKKKAVPPPSRAESRITKEFFLVAFLRRRPSLLSFLEARSDSGIERGEGIWRGAMGRRRRRRNFGGVAARKRGGGEGKRKEFEYSFSPPSIAVCLPPPPALLQIVMEPTHPHGSGGGGGGRTPFSTLSFLRLLRAEERPPTSENGQLRIFALPPWLMRT